LYLVHHAAHQHDPDNCDHSLTPEGGRGFWLGWSLWRRAHQAVAKRSHAATREAERDPLQERVPDLASPAQAMTTTKFFSTLMVTRLTDEKWECVRSLMPSQKPSTGLPRWDHRQVLAEMVWVFGTGSSWRELPEEEFAPWREVYGRYREWRKKGHWQRIIEALRHCRCDADDT
jgi:transposase